MWNNHTPLKVIQWAYEFIPRSPTCLVDDILDPRCHSCVVCHDDWPPLAVVNRVGLPWIALLPTFLSFPHFHAFRSMDDLESHSSNMEEPNANEKERAMGFRTSADALPSPGLNPFEGPTMLSYGKLGLGRRSRFPALERGRGVC
jgi:hypothetical protein